MMDSIGLAPRAHERDACPGAVETAGGAMLAAGFLTPVAGAALTGNMGDRHREGAPLQRVLEPERRLRVPASR
jgi:hypothetical protein